MQLHAHIRAARIEEAAALSALALRAKASWGYPQSALSMWADELRITAEHIESKPTFVALVDEAIAGFCSLDAADSICILEHVWVEPHAMRRGIGKSLVVHALETARARGAKLVRLVADPNAAAFYVVLGARQDGSLPAPIPGEPHRTVPQFYFSIGTG